MHNFQILIAPQRQKTYLRTCAPSEDSYQPAHSCSLIRIFTRWTTKTLIRRRGGFGCFFLDGDVPRRTSYGVYISRLIRFARASSNLSDFNCRNKALNAKLLRQGYRYFKLRKAFSKFYRKHSALVEKYSVSLKTLLQQGISEPEFYGDVVYRFRKIVGKSNFLEQFRKLINHYKRIGYSLDIMRQTACLVINPKLLMAMLHSLIARRRFGPQTQ